MANFFESLWNEIIHPSATATGDVNDGPVDKALIRRMGLTYKGLDENGHKVWEDDAGHQYTAAQLQKHDDSESQQSSEPLMGDPPPYPQSYYSGPPRNTNPVTDTGGVTSTPSTYPQNDTKMAWILEQAKARIKKDAEGEIKKAIAEGKAIRINVQNYGPAGDHDNSFYYQEQTPGEGGLLTVNINTYTDEKGNATTGYVDTHTTTNQPYTPPGDIEGTTPTSGSGTGGSTGGTGTDPSGGGSGSGGTGTSPSGSGGGDSSGGSSSHDDEKDCDCNKQQKKNKPETYDRKNDPTLVTYKQDVTKKLKDEVTDSADVVADSPATRSPAVSHHKPESWEHGPYMPDDDDDYYDPTLLPPPPPREIKSILDLYKNFKDRVSDGLDRETMPRIINELENDTQLNIISTIYPKYYFRDNAQGGLTTDVETNNVNVTSGDMVWAASDLSRFITFILALGHEHVHSLQNNKLHLTTHNEKEMMAYFFTLFPNEFIQWIYHEYPGAIGREISFNFPNLKTLAEIRYYSQKFYNYYNRLPIILQYRYRYFFEKVRRLDFSKILFQQRFYPPLIPE